ncbi:A-kinase anchor protein 6 [Chanos chanos]|uniref:A-kinase anchor protein 6 n=1 Tax=Chanos chanos TaxID=29144 RepID=A0A6J2WIJ3_CHACN|nr:A-kinase anchor protein 6 [Chanos chanos]
MNVVVSPAASEAASPMITSVTPILEHCPKDEEPSPCGSSMNGDEVVQDQDLRRRNQKPPPLHTGADWKVVLHLPEIETWLRATTERVRDLTQSVHQDSLNKHVDVHLVQLKDICEDISDHVEQIHALLETEFSLKLLSYSVNIIVDIRTVQVLWHQLRVSVLVLKERLLQGLQDSNGNYTRQTDILQAFSQDHDQARLDALTEVDDSGQLTIKCSQDYFSLDCGITAFELSDYSPSEDLEDKGTGQEPRCLYPELEKDFPELLKSVDLLTTAAGRLSPKPSQGSSPTEEPGPSGQKPTDSSIQPAEETSLPAPAMQSESSVSKRPLQGCYSTDASPTQPSLPKKPMYQDGDAEPHLCRSAKPSNLQYQADISRSTPSLLDPPDRSKFWLELDSVYPGNGSQSYENLHATNLRNRQHSATFQRPPVPGGASAPFQRSNSERCPKNNASKDVEPEAQQSNSDSESPLLSPAEDSSDRDPRDDSSSPEGPSPAPPSLWITPHVGNNVPQTTSLKEEHWYGSDEFLALPAQLRKTEMLALKLESLAKALPQRPLQEPIQDVDDWELTEANPDWESNPNLLPLHPCKKSYLMGRFSPTSSSDIAPSLDESIESGPLSDLLSEDEAGWSRPQSRKGDKTAVVLSKASRMAEQYTPLIQKLLEDIQHQENYQEVWGKIEGFVSKLDEFIGWLRQALECTENWTPPRAEMDCLKLYLETHLSFKLNVDSHCSLKDAVLEEGRQLLEVIISHKSGLRDMLQMIAHQWQELQRQIRRQHSWMLRTLDIIKAQILATESSPVPRVDRASPEVEVQQSHREAQKDALHQMCLKLRTAQHWTSISRNTDFTHMTKSNSLSEFESDYQELWDWLMDMESIVTDSHELMMSEEQQQHLFKGNSVEMAIWLPKKTQLLGWAESLKRSGSELPVDFDERVSALKHKWDQLQKTLAEHLDNRASSQNPRSLLSPNTNGMLGQLERRIKELKSWLRDTELFIFNLSLQPDAEHDPHSHPQDQVDSHGAKRLQQFRALCIEVRGRRKGMASVLRLCQRLLESEQMCSETERQTLQLLQVNLERRWEAIVMQLLQWQNRLKRSLGQDQVQGNFIEPSLMDLRGPAEDSWEWDEMDMTIVNVESQESDDKPDCESKLHLDSPTDTSDVMEMCPNATQHRLPLNNPCQVYQVYNLHSVEMYHQPQYDTHNFSSAKAKGKLPLLKSLSKDSSFSSIESLPDILAGLVSGKQSLGSELARRSESESGIVSEGDTETTANSETCLLYQGDEPRVSVNLTPPTRADSPCVDQVCDEHIDRVLERANKCAQCEDSNSLTIVSGKDQRCRVVRRKREEGGENKRKHRKESVQILINGCGLGPDSEDEGRDSAAPDEEKLGTEGKIRKELTHLSQGSSLDSLCTAGDLFPSSKETLHRSTSLESWLAPCKNSDDAGSQGSLRDLGLATESTGELSRRTLELLKRLENIQTPLSLKMTRSISDVTLQSSSLRLPGRSPLSAGATSSVNESSAASLTELSSTDDFSAGSEDMAAQKNRSARDSNASFRKHCHGQQMTEEADANVSMVVNVSCNSACTDDEDDADLLSSSTLTLTEEELGIKDDEDSSITSEEEYIEGSFALGLDYMKSEFQRWIKPRSQGREKNEADLGDELQCGTLSRDILSPMESTNDRQFLSRSVLKLLESNSNTKNESLKQQDMDSNRRDATRSYISRFVDDMENGNVDNAPIKGKDEDDELLREEGSLFTKTGESFKDCYASGNQVKGDARGMVAVTSSASGELLSSQSKESSLESQLKGELPCHSSRRASPSLSPMEECSGSLHGILGASHGSHGQEQLVSFLNDVQEHQGEGSPDCCTHPAFPSEEEKNEDVHSFVMEIIDMASVALKTKEGQTDKVQESSSPTPTAQIREKVLEHSHRPIHLRKGDFYNYLSLSSHDSDCGEVTTCVEDKSSTPLLSSTPDIRDEEPLFEACTEEVYLGPPLCYSMTFSKRPGRCSTKRTDSSCPQNQILPLACNEYQKAHGISPGSIARSQPECRNEPPYLNPLPCETSIDTVECFADTKMLESNISPVMTKIRASCSGTNPLKEGGSLYINPKINCPPIRKSDRDERGPASQWMKQKNVRKGRNSPEETKSTHKQLPRSERSWMKVGCGAQGSVPLSDSSSAVRSGNSSGPQVRMTTESDPTHPLPSTSEPQHAHPMPDP